MPEATRRAFLASLSPQEKAELYYRWPFWARGEQIAPGGDWRTWLLLAGRGFGKTRTGVEWVIEEVRSARLKRVGLVARTAADVRDVMIEGESGILACSPPWFLPKYEPSKRRLTWPNGAIATTYSADKPDLLRGPQHDGAWADEIASWRYDAAWDNLMMGLRLGADPRVVATTTPRPVKLVRELLKDSTTAITRGSTYDNRANLAPAFLKQIILRYEGTRLGRQELLAELLDDNPYALWKRSQIEALRVRQAPALVRIVVGVDPQVADVSDLSDDSDVSETGIVAVGMDGRDPEHYYVLEDRSLCDTPHTWGSAVVNLYREIKADRVIGEVNNGGAMVEHTLRTIDASLSFTAVHASRGKYVRAEPVSALYEQGRVHHIGCFPELEDQMCEWMPGEKSPDRMDALVWAVTELDGGLSPISTVPSIWR